MPNCWSISGRTSILAPLSMSSTGPFDVGITGAKAGRFTPLIRFTIRVDPIISAPLLPAVRNASPPPSASSLSPTAIDELFFDFIISPASSSIVMTSGASLSSKPSNDKPFSSAVFFIISIFPTSTISRSSYLSLQIVQPFIISRGALSPPNASTMTFIFFTTILL